MGFNEPRSQLVGFNTRPPSILQAASVLVRMSSLLLALFTFASVTAFSGIDMYLKIPGVDAESVGTNHRDWIDIEGYGHSVSAIIAPPGQAGNRHQGSTHQRRVVVKRTDKSTPKLNESVCTGMADNDVAVELDRIIGNTTALYYPVEWTTCWEPAFRPAGMHPKPPSNRKKRSRYSISRSNGPITNSTQSARKQSSNPPTGTSFAIRARWTERRSIPTWMANSIRPIPTTTATAFRMTTRTRIKN